MENNQFHHACYKEMLTFLSGRIIHDLNNVLSSVLGFAELAKLGLNQGDSVEKELSDVVRAALKARDLSSRISALIHQNRAPFIPADAVHLAKYAVRLIRAMLPASFDIRFQPGEYKGLIWTDPLRFQQILMILSSVVSHSRKNVSGLLQISLQAIVLNGGNEMPFASLKPGGYLLLTIGNSPSGPVEDIKRQMIDPGSVPQSPAASFPGRSLVQDMANEMNAAVLQCLDAEGGAVFHIFFPEYSAAPQTSGAKSREPA